MLDRAEDERISNVGTFIEDIKFNLLRIVYNMTRQQRVDISTRTEHDLALLAYAQNFDLPAPPVPNGITNPNFLTNQERDRLQYCNMKRDNERAT